MRKSFKQTAAAVMALMSLGTTVQPANVAAPSEQTQASQKRGKEQTPPVQVTHQQQIKNDAGGLQVIQHGREGIPPHIYGQHHVRKGTHKRTNKK